MTWIISHGHVCIVLLKKTNTRLSKFVMGSYGPKTDCKMDRSTSIAFFVHSCASFKKNTDMIQFSRVNSYVKRSVLVVITFVKIIGATESGFCGHLISVKCVLVGIIFCVRWCLRTHICRWAGTILQFIPCGHVTGTGTSRDVLRIIYGSFQFGWASSTS